MAKTLYGAVAAAVLAAATLYGNPTQTAIGQRLVRTAEMAPGDLALYDRNADAMLDGADAVKALLGPNPTPTPTATATASPTPTATPSPTPDSGAEARLAQQCVGTAYDAAVFASDAVELGVRAVFLASELAGTNTATGTLTATEATNNNFTYSPTPSDRLVIITFQGRRIEYRFSQLTGNTSSPDSFIAQHQMRFTYTEATSHNVEIVSAKDYTRAWNAAWQRSITGSFLSGTELVTVNLQHNGTETGSVESGFTELNRSETHTGTMTSPSANVTVNESSFFIYIQNSNQGVVVQNKGITSNSTATLGGATYACQNVNVRWEQYTLLNDPGQFNVVRDANYWQAGGTMTKNGALWGTAGFSGPVTPGTKGPDFVLNFQAGGPPALLHTCIPDL
jgi:hypothetical protein